MVNGAVKSQSKIDIDRVFVVLYSTPPSLTEVILLHHRRERFAGPVALLNNYLELAEKTAQHFQCLFPNNSQVVAKVDFFKVPSSVFSNDLGNGSFLVVRDGFSISEQLKLFV